MVATAVLVSTPAVAAENYGWYAGAQPGWSSFDVKRGDAEGFISDAANLAGVTVDSFSSKLSKDSFTGDLFAGYQFNPYVAVELAYMDLGDATARVSGTYTNGDVSTGTFDGHLKFRSQGAALSVLPMYPVSEAWNIYGRLGAYVGDTKLSDGVSVVDSVAGTVTDHASVSKTKTEFLWGAGVGYEVSRQAAIRLEYDGIPKVGDKNQTGEVDVSRVALGVDYRF
jgi:opacity protein-like surface antigen